jgi:hypothetical protein
MTSNVVICTSNHLAAELDPIQGKKVIIRRKMKCRITNYRKQQSIARTTKSLKYEHCCASQTPDLTVEQGLALANFTNKGLISSMFSKIAIAYSPTTRSLCTIKKERKGKGKEKKYKM